MMRRDAIVVSLGSASVLKIEAVKKAFGKGFSVVGYDVPSGVPSQPVGQEQTLEGARNRAYHAKKLHPSARYSIGIENGMWLDVHTQCWVDGAACVLLDHVTDDVHIGWSDLIFICWKQHCRVCCALDEDNGATLLVPLGPDEQWAIQKDPHEVLTGKPRSVYLQDTIKRMLKHVTTL